MLFLRPAVAFSLLLATAATFALLGDSRPVDAAAAWWLWFMTGANIASLLALRWAARAEGLRVRDLYLGSRASWRGDLGWLLLAMPVTGLLSMLPGTLLAGLLWEDPNTPNLMLLQPLPASAVWPLFLIMPLTQALTELPVYFGYVAPRLLKAGLRPWQTLLIAGSVLSVQHLFLSFQLDVAFGFWLAVKFLPFALWIGLLVQRRPTLLPYLMVVHFLLDFSLPFFIPRT